MGGNAGVLIAVTALVFIALAALAAYRWRQRRRVLRVQEWVKGYLLTRYGEQPSRLDINCSDDPLWPVLVSFDLPRTGVHHRLRFACQGPSSLSLLAEKEVARQRNCSDEPPIDPNRRTGEIADEY